MSITWPSDDRQPTEQAVSAAIWDDAGTTEQSVYGLWELCQMNQWGGLARVAPQIPLPWLEWFASGGRLPRPAMVGKVGCSGHPPIPFELQIAAVVVPAVGDDARLAAVIDGDGHIRQETGWALTGARGHGSVLDAVLASVQTPTACEVLWRALADRSEGQKVRLLWNRACPKSCAEEYLAQDERVQSPAGQFAARAVLARA